MTYYSKRALGDLAEGLINGVIEYYQENITCSASVINNSNGKKVEFKLIKS